MTDSRQTPEEHNSDSSNHTRESARNSLLHEALSTGTGKHAGSLLARSAIILVITLLLLIPLAFVKDIVSERQTLQMEAANNISTGWGKTQQISGPLLVVPYEVWQDCKKTIKVKEDKEEKDKEVIERILSMRYKLILPADLRFDAQIDPQIRYRGIYRQILYTSSVSIQGHFTLPVTADFPSKLPTEENVVASNLQKIHWDKAWLAVGIADLKAVTESGPLQWAGGAVTAYKPGAKAEKVLGPGFHADLSLTDKAAGAKQEFALKLALRGSNGMYFTPVGGQTAITLAGAWPAPSFQGDLLPVERSITDKDFSARWNISNLTRTYPQIEDVIGNPDKTQALGDIRKFTAGVALHETISLYRMVRRAVHYAILFIAASFVTLFAFEMASDRRMHLLQYGMVGLSMSLFYLVLLSLAEHVNFGLAFLAAGAVTAGMNSLYVAAALQSKARGLAMAVLLISLYSLLFSLLRMEDYALLVGTGLLVAMMAVLMFVTRKLTAVQEDARRASGL